MPCLPVARFGGGRPEILQNMHAHRAGAAAFISGLFNPLNKVAQFYALAQTYLAQGIPDFRLQPHAGAAVNGRNVPVDQSTSRHNTRSQP